MEWEIGSLGRGKVRLSLVRVAGGDTLCDVLDQGTAQACFVLSGELDVTTPGGQSRSVDPGKVAVMAGPGTFCLHAREVFSGPPQSDQTNPDAAVKLMPSKIPAMSVWSDIGLSHLGQTKKPSAASVRWRWPKASRPLGRAQVGRPLW